MKRRNAETREPRRNGATSACFATGAVNELVRSVPKKTVSVIDSDSDGRHCIRAYLGNSQGFGLDQWYTKPEEGIKGIANHPPTVAAINTYLAGADGIECAHTLKGVLPRLNVIMFAAAPELSSYIRSFQAGADGYFVMPGTQESFEQMLHDVVAGWKPCSREIQKLIIERLTQTSVLPDVAGSLTRTEQKVISHMILGLSDKEIATITGTATSTVHAIANHIYKKLHVHNRREAINTYLGFNHVAASRTGA